MIKFIKVAIFTIIGIVLIPEIILRIGFYEQLKIHKYPLIYKSDSIMGYSHIPNIDARICIPSIDKKFHLNNHGFIGADFSNVKEEGKIRVAIVGNSITEGIWYNSTENYVMKVQELLVKNGYPNIEIINCSMGGIDKDLKNYLHIKYYVYKFNPDIILFNVGIPFYNDNESRCIYKNFMIRFAQGSIRSRQKAIEKVDNLKKHKFFIFFYNVSFIFRAYCKNYSENNYGDFVDIITTYRDNSSSAPDILTYQYSLQTSIRLLSDLNIDLSNKGINLIVWPFRADDRISKSLKDNGILFIQNDIRLTEDVIYKHDGHPNEYGHKKIANSLYPLLLGILKKLNKI